MYDINGFVNIMNKQTRIEMMIKKLLYKLKDCIDQNKETSYTSFVHKKLVDTINLLNDTNLNKELYIKRLWELKI